MSETGASTGAGPSWEDIVNWVVLPTNTGKLQQAADSWHAATVELDELQKSVAQLPTESRTWTGAGADAWRNYASGISKAMQTHHQTYEKVWNALQTLAEVLNKAIPRIPLPPGVVGDVEQKRQSGGGSPFPANEFYRTILDWMVTHYPIPPYTREEIFQETQKAYDEGARRAREVYQEVLTAYRNALSALPNVPAAKKTTTGASAAKKAATTAAKNALGNNPLGNLAGLGNLANAATAATTPTMSTTPAIDTTGLNAGLDNLASGLDNLSQWKPDPLKLDPLKDSKFGLASSDPLGGAGGGGGAPKLGGVGGLGGLPKLGPSITDMMAAERGMTPNGAPVMGLAGAGGTSSTNTSGMMAGGMPAGGHGGKDGQEWRAGMDLTEDGAFGVEQAAPHVIT